MLKLFLSYFFLFIFLVFSNPAQAAGNSYVSIVNPVRGEDFWDLTKQPIETAVLGQIQILEEFKMSATFLIRFDALTKPQIINSLKSTNHEKGLFLEVTPSWTKKAGVIYRESAVWHLAGSVFLSGYNIEERKKLIDVAFEEFKKTFGFYPKSVGAWWIDSYSLKYMQTKYDIDAALIVADQYSTDNYQIWGQYFGTPYYPAEKNTLMPAQNIGNKIPVVVMQWATRDPINGYGEGVNETTYSVQANDYTDYHKLGSDYFGKLVDIYMGQTFNQFNHLVVGLENSYSWQKYKDEYRKQIEILYDREQKGQLSTATMEGFSKWYKIKFPDVSPDQLIVADNPIDATQKVVWYMNPYYRVGWFYNKNGSVLRDVRQYVEGQSEPCYLTACNYINFATFSTRVLDDVTYKQKLVLDKGKIKDFSVEKEGTNYLLNYTNEAGRKRQLEFLPRDISIDGKINSIDVLILQAKNSQVNDTKVQIEFSSNKAKQYQESIGSLSLNVVKFLLFVILVFFIPGFLIIRLLKQESRILNVFLSVCSGFVGLVLISFGAGYLKTPWLIYIYVAISLIVFIRGRFFQNFSFKKENLSTIQSSMVFIILILFGTLFQSLVMIRSGWVYDFGVGFWGPTGHDGIWHQALVNQLIKQVPPSSPILAGEILKDYHYFFDLLVAITFKLTQIPVLDLLYRFYPILFSLFLGVGTVCLLAKITKNKLVIFISLYFVYFAGSFGWIVTYLRDKSFSGESAFWVNQPVSMNLNPPFVISLLIMIAIILLVSIFRVSRNIWAAVLLVLLIGPLIEFKIYAGVVVLGGLLLVGLLEVLRNRNFDYLKIFIASFVFSALMFLSQNKEASGILIWSPFWFIHSMIDSPDRVGWNKLSLARPVYFARGEWLKFVGVEVLSLIMFIIGNLGFRVLSILGAESGIKKKLWQVPEYFLMFLIGIISLIIPIFLIQKGNSWNTIQFMYYLIYLGGVFAGFGLVSIFNKLPKILGFVILGLILLLTPINGVVTFKESFGLIPPAALSQNELEALTFFKKLPDGTVLTYPYDNTLSSKFKEPIPLFAYQTTAYVSAFSGKAVFVEDTMQNDILQTDYHQRLVESADFWNSGNLPKNLDGQIRYIYLPKFLGVNIDNDKFHLKNIFENKEVLIYEINS